LECERGGGGVEGKRGRGKTRRAGEDKERRVEKEGE